eukprot:scaffold62137_cov41-Tisochrysis_lutea.AAC.2
MSYRYEKNELVGYPWSFQKAASGRKACLSSARRLSGSTRSNTRGASRRERERGVSATSAGSAGHNTLGLSLYRIPSARRYESASACLPSRERSSASWCCAMTARAMVAASFELPAQLGRAAASVPFSIAARSCSSERAAPRRRRLSVRPLAATVGLPTIAAQALEYSSDTLLLLNIACPKRRNRRCTLHFDEFAPWPTVDMALARIK